MNPFAPSPLRAAIGKVFVKLEDMTERFEDWCQYGNSEERTEQPLGQRVSNWLALCRAAHRASGSSGTWAGAGAPVGWCRW